MQTHDLRAAVLHRDGRHRKVVDTVVADDMSFVDHPLYQLRLRFYIRLGDKKDRRGLLLFKHIQNIVGITVLVPFIKGQINLHLVLGDKVGIVLPILFLIGSRTARAIFLVGRTTRSPSQLGSIQPAADRRNRLLAFLFFFLFRFLSRLFFLWLVLRFFSCQLVL